MSDYLKRYNAGERRYVWEELVALGPTVRQEPHYSQAHAVAEEMIWRSLYNLDLIWKRLDSLDFRLAGGWSDPHKYLLKDLEEAQQQYGPLPLVVDFWFRVIGEISLTGFHPTLSHHYEVRYEFPHIEEEGPDNSDPLEVVFVGAEEEEEMDEEIPGLVIANDIAGKAGYSGAPTLKVPFDARFDAPFIEDESERWEGVFFIPYLQTCFDWGGFPGLEYDPEAAERAREELAFLTEGLLPLL